MAFSEKIKFEVKKKSHNTCCVCKQIGIEIHHIIPQSEGGSDKEENAAPLCPSCHETYGANPTKRKFIKESKEIWLEICSKRYSSESIILNQLSERIELIENKLGIKAESIYSSIEESQNQLSKNEEDFSISSYIKILTKIESPSIENSSEFTNFHTSYHLVFKTVGDGSKDGKRFNYIRKKFLEVFGRLIAEKIVLHQMSVYGINWIKGVSEPTLLKFMAGCKLFMIALLTHSDFEKKDMTPYLSITPEEQAVIDSIIPPK